MLHHVILVGIEQALILWVLSALLFEPSLELIRHFISVLLDDRQLIGGSHDLAPPFCLAAENDGVAHIVGMLVNLVRSLIVFLSFLDQVARDALLDCCICPLDQVFYSLLIYSVFF